MKKKGIRGRDGFEKKEKIPSVNMFLHKTYIYAYMF